LVRLAQQDRPDPQVVQQVQREPLAQLVHKEFKD